MSQYRTQKARGISVLLYNSPFNNYQLPVNSLGDYAVAVFPHKYNAQLPCFARPCPTVPRHGFVDSRLVSTVAEVLAVIAETQKADPNGEVIFMPRLSGVWSGVATHAGVTFGHRNDGATAGHSAHTIPAYSTTKSYAKSLDHYNYLLSDATISGTPYVEFVEDNGQPVFVQLRDGPEVPRSTNYIPKAMTVKEVIEVDTSMDLLEWESLIAHYIGKPGVVVHHPRGSLTTHFSVHALVHQIAVILDSEAPRVGDKLKPQGWEPNALTPTDYKAIAKHMARRFRKTFKGHEGNREEDTGNSNRRSRSVVLNTIATLHASPQWGNEDHLLRLRAEGYASILYYTTSACMGEVRHWYEVGPGQQPDNDEGSSNHCGNRHCRSCNEEYGKGGDKSEVDYSTSPAPTLTVLNLEPETKFKREKVYQDALAMNAEDLMIYAGQASVDLCTPGWDDGFGGKGWAEAGLLASDGFRLAFAFIENPNAETWGAIMGNYNQLIHATHNNGAILTKWVSSTTMSNIAVCPGPAFINSFTAEVVLGIVNRQLHHSGFEWLEAAE